ncbi:hypothetical protein HFO56_00485 [Rhizobium laguerreae]|uniref:DUF6384 family protein n=1 Tax=Rhizobium laguerreae TaxID=1076926 RepID=UPI001C91672D|nr:DUF6384 family protein [Rhizobium laguerreae]MBY3150905.1 hypothetical protein [Rhizobium laguerreae]
MNSQKHAKFPVPPPSVDDLLPHLPLRGVRRLAALAAIRRVPQFACLALLGVGVCAAALTLADKAPVSHEVEKLAALPTGVKTDAASTEAPAESPVITLPVAVVETVPLPTVAPQQTAVKDVAEAAGKPTISDTRESSALPVVPGSTADMAAVDIGDLAAAVDTLGIRAQNIETALVEPKPGNTDIATAATSSEVKASGVDETQLRYLAARKDEAGLRQEIARPKQMHPDWTPPGEIQPTSPPDARKLPEMSPEDAAVHARLEARLKELEGKGDKAGIKAARAELEMFEATLATMIEFRIVDRKGEKPGFWRTLVGDPDTKQFFVVVEAVVDGQQVNWAVRDADSGKVVSSAKFALRVDEKTFAELSADKKDDGRIADMVVGLKPVGRITPVWSIKTDGETVTGF